MTKTTGEVYDDNGTLKLRNVSEGWTWEFTPLQMQFINPVEAETLSVLILPNGTKKVARVPS